MKILFYETPYYLFSNWSAHAVVYKGISYPTAEHAYHSQRFTDSEIIQKILTAKSPYEAKRITQEYIDQQKSDWDDVKISIMGEIITEKILQHEDVKKTLLQTGDAELIENSPVDYFWGIGENGTGQNELGKIWMNLRELFKAVSSED